MKLSQSTTNSINEIFKSTLDEKEQNSRKIASKWYTKKLLALFIKWLNDKQRNWLKNWEISYKILNTLKRDRKKSFFKDKYYNSVVNSFSKFVECFLDEKNRFKLENLLSDYFYYEKKNNLIKDSDSIMITWQEFMEKDESDNWKIYFNKLEYLYRILSEEELKSLFTLLNKCSKELRKNKNNPDIDWDHFEFIKNKLDEILRSKYYLTEENIWYINSLFWKYLNFLKLTKYIREDFSKKQPEDNNKEDNSKEEWMEIDYEEISLDSNRWVYIIKDWEVKAPEEGYWIFSDLPDFWEWEEIVDEEKQAEEQKNKKEKKKKKYKRKKENNNQTEIDFW